MRTALIEIMLDFFRNFTDKCPHAEEEKHLFPLLEKKGMAHDTKPSNIGIIQYQQ